MKRCLLPAFMFAAFCALVSLSGCSYVSVQAHQYLGMPEFPPTDPAGIVILHAPPARPHDRIGEITLFPEGNPTTGEIEQKLRNAAARMGANAVVIVSDSIKDLGEYSIGPWWDRRINTEWGRVIVAVGIRYLQEEQHSPAPDKGESQERQMRFAVINSP